MQRRPRQLARLLRALIACCALILAGAAPAPVVGAEADVSGWLVAQVSAPAARTRTAPRGDVRSAPSAAPRSLAAVTSLTPASPARTLTLPPPAEQLPARRDGRHLYLEIQTLLC